MSSPKKSNGSVGAVAGAPVEGWSILDAHSDEDSGQQAGGDNAQQFRTRVAKLE